MGELLRQYWLPCLAARELPAPDGPPKKVRLLGEDLVAFRDTQGQSGCSRPLPSSRASLFHGGTRRAGSAVLYHGWKFDVTGRCVDMPTSRTRAPFRDKVRARAYTAET